MSHPFTIKGNWENFDTEYYYQHYPDLQQACMHLNDTDRRQWLLNHFYTHGFSECRRWRLKLPQCEQKSNRCSSSCLKAKCNNGCQKCEKYIEPTNFGKKDKNGKNKKHSGKCELQKKIWEIANNPIYKDDQTCNKICCVEKYRVR